MTKTFAQLAAHWVPRVITDARCTLRDVGPYRVILDDGKVIGHTFQKLDVKVWR